MTADSVVCVGNLSKKFGRRVVLDSINLELTAGTSMGLVGLNGAGKTTLIRILLGLLEPNRGAKVSVLGMNPWRHDAALFRRLGIVLEHDGFEGSLDFRTNIRFFGAAKGMEPRDVEAYCREFWRDTPIFAERKPVKHFSRGQRMQCALCRAFLNWPQLLLLDEPAIALDIDAYDHFCRLVREALRRGASLLISSNVMETIEDLCSTVAVLHEGKITVQSLTANTDNEKELWCIGGENDMRYASLISQVTGSTPLYESNHWSFFVSRAETTIPLLVQRLVEAGLAVRSVVKKPLRLRELLRRK